MPDGTFFFDLTVWEAKAAAARAAAVEFLQEEMEAEDQERRFREDLAKLTQEPKSDTSEDRAPSSRLE